jgi:large subunit ribosomal protein L10
MSTEHHSEHIPQWKKDEIEYIRDKIKSYPVIGIVSMADIPAKQMQTIRRSLRNLAVLKMSRNSLIERALSSFEDNSVADLKNYISAQTALIFTEESPFKLYKILESSKSPAPIKGGSVAPKDIIVEKGPTPFPPGPIVGELQNAGIPAAIEGGKVVIRETKTVAKAGEVVSNSLATMLTRLEIYPLVIGLDLQAVYENGLIFKPEELAIDEQAYIRDIVQAVQSAFNLSVNTAYPTGETIETLLVKAALETRNLAINAEVILPETLGDLFGKASAQMFSLASVVFERNADSVGDELKSLLGGAREAEPAVEESVEEETKQPTEKEEEAEESDEEAAAGLGALFG